MLLLWKIRYLDRTEKQFKDRYLYLHTPTLEPLTRAVVEFAAENRSPKSDREILKYRHLFVEGTPEKIPGAPIDWTRFMSVGPSEYFEDETEGDVSSGDGPRPDGRPYGAVSAEGRTAARH